MTFHAALNVGRALGMSDLLVNEPKPTPGHEAVLQELKDTRARALESYITSKINAETKLVMDSYVENMAQLMWAPLGNLVPNKLVPNAGGEYKYKYTNIWMQDSVGPRYKPVEFKTCAGSVNVIRETMTAVGVQPDKLAQISAVSAVLNRTVNDGPPLGPQLYDGLTAEQCLGPGMRDVWQVDPRRVPQRALREPVRAVRPCPWRRRWVDRPASIRTRCASVSGDCPDPLGHDMRPRHLRVARAPPRRARCQAMNRAAWQRAVRAIAAEYGCMVQVTGHNHLRLAHPSGWIVIASGSSSDTRAADNLRAELRRQARRGAS